MVIYVPSSQIKNIKLNQMFFFTGSALPSKFNYFQNLIKKLEAIVK